MVAADALLLRDVVVVTGRRAAEFAAPHDERVLEHVALFQIGEQCVQRLIGGTAEFAMALVVEVVRVPVVVIHLHEAHAAFGETTREQELTAHFRIAVQLAHGLRLAREIKGIRRLDLHAEGRLERAHATFEQRIAGVLLREVLVHRPHQVQLAALLAQRRRAAADVFDHSRDRRVFRRDARAAAPRGEEGVAPLLVAARRGAIGRKRDEAGEILIFRAEPIHRPRADARPHTGELTRVHDELRRLMHAGFRVHGADHAEFVRMLRELWKQFADLHPALPVLFEFER